MAQRLPYLVLWVLPGRKLIRVGEAPEVLQLQYCKVRLLRISQVYCNFWNKHGGGLLKLMLFEVA